MHVGLAYDIPITEVHGFDRDYLIETSPVSTEDVVPKLVFHLVQCEGDEQEVLIKVDLGFWHSPALFSVQTASGGSFIIPLRSKSRIHDAGHDAIGSQLRANKLTHDRDVIARIWPKLKLHSKVRDD